MNYAMVQRLILKDWYLHRGAIFGCIVIGVMALALIGFASGSSLFIGNILLITVLIGGGAYLVMYTVIDERTNQNLPFVMSLPISPLEYTIAKILANLFIYIVPWIILTIGSLVVIAGSDEIPDGLMPFSTILSVEIFAGYCLLLAVALISESQGWSIGTMVLGNIFFNYFLYVVSHIPAIENAMEGPIAVWDATVLGILSAEVGVIVLLIALTFYFQSRKKDFVC